LAGSEAGQPLAVFRQHECQVTNLFLPGGVSLFEGDFDPVAYGGKLFPQAQEAGVLVMVVGSGNQRKAPEGMEPDAAEDEFVRIVAAWQKQALRHGVQLAPESLRSEETNVGNRLSSLAQKLGAAGVGYCADSYHVLSELDEEELDPTTIGPALRRELPFTPLHVHLAARDRTPPAAEDPHLQAFAHRLRELNYNGRISVEANWSGAPGEKENTLSHLKRLFSWK
jgi:sugar phosphate isomerase/epimerase